jgi:sigma-E factor negative regulatory protein RseB
MPEQIQTIRENYQVIQGEEDRVADYHAHTVVFQPKDNLRYARKMWAHSESGLLLKAVVLDKQGIVIEQYAFSHLSIGGSINRNWTVPNESESDAVLMAHQRELSPQPKASIENVSCGWQVDAMPSGFKKIHELRRTIANKKFPVVHIVYSDGLAGISVFIEKVSEATDMHLGLSSQGAVHIYSRMVGDSLVTVVGEVPPRAVIQVADSVRYAGE